jgi:hypothetical protein
LNTLFGKHRANADLLSICVGRHAFAHDIFAEARTFVDPEYPGNAAGYSANDTADHCANRTGCRAAFGCAAFRAAHYALRIRRKRERRRKSRRTDQKFQPHSSLLD